MEGDQAGGGRGGRSTCFIPIASDRAGGRVRRRASRPRRRPAFGSAIGATSRGGRGHGRDRAGWSSRRGGRGGGGPGDARDGCGPPSAGGHGSGHGGALPAAARMACDGSRAMRCSRSGGSATRRRLAWMPIVPARSCTTWREEIPRLGLDRTRGMRREAAVEGCRSAARLGLEAGRRRARCSAGRMRCRPAGLRGGADGRWRVGGGAGGCESVRRCHRRGWAAGGGVPGRGRAAGADCRGACRDGGAARPVQGAAGEYDARLPDDRSRAVEGGVRSRCTAAAAGLSRAVEPVFTDVDGDVVFCLAAGDGAEG